MSTPILWSFRRCPYAMRARLAVAYAGQPVELREIVLRAKPDAFLETSPSATVPCLQTPDQILDESFDIMLWALAQNDRDGWLNMPATGFDLITTADGPFKQALDRYKYASRLEDVDTSNEQQRAGEFLMTLDQMLDGQNWLFGDQPRLADMAILPFVRQFAHVDLAWFTAQPWPNVTRWLDTFKVSGQFTNIMTKYTPWAPGDAPIQFP